MKEKELYYENAITKILKEDILQSLHGSGYSHASSTFQDPASAHLCARRKLCQLLFLLSPAWQL